MPVAGAIPTVARNLVGFAKSAGGENNCFGAKNFEPTAFAIVSEGADDAVAIFQQRYDANLHVNLDSLMHAMILQRANHFQTGAIPNVRQTRIFVSAKIALKNATIFCAIEHRAQGSGSRTRSGASFACSSAIRQLFTY